ncbi:protein kinase [Anaerocolumna sedimenticola]|uniref:non-specific serine/threonine protein kinase n=1 Tax=Anaerocolumna sedimenticola TaxID=2696063 RepID=A0A6P1TJK1_9FIRM|nr:serine/threonine-protein kinase [Anaerocolumna sedimenticola]QHQ60086.1 protein kinase [Anaerocolumna sedimenticola]
MSDQIWFQKYRIIKLLGRGGSAEVFLAEHIKLKSLRAIKRISKDHIQHEQLLNEAYILKNLKHSCIPVIYDFEEDVFNSYIIEQYIEGTSLKVFRQQYRQLKENLILKFAIQICDLLQYLYSLDNPILYLDLKPENIIVSDNVVKLIDFGASVFKNNLFERKFSFGTKGYAAPELYTGHTPDERTDIYGIGALLYYMAAGTTYDCKLLKGYQNKYIKRYSKSLQRIIEQCLRQHPFLRYPSVYVLKNKLLEINHKKIICRSINEESISIAVAGTQHRIGTTHLSILITAYYNKYGNKALYMERNDSNHISEILNRYQNIKTKDGICQIFNCNILPNFTLNLPINKQDYPVTVMDYGCLDTNNLEDYLRADIKLIISGGKEWELGNTEEVLRLLNKQEDIKYLFNFLDGNQFGKIIKHMDKLNCYRIPYEPDPFMQKNNEYLNDLIKSLIKA